MGARANAEHAPGRPGPWRVFLSGEIGIGAAAVLDGPIMTGQHGFAGEIGHLCVDPHGPPCRCGSNGCLELYAGRRAIAAEAGVGDDVGGSQLADLAEGGHRGAVRAIDRAASALTTALVARQPARRQRRSYLRWV
jgi:predicted NBD/HSP70 family sugar kinase